MANWHSRAKRQAGVVRSKLLIEKATPPAELDESFAVHVNMLATKSLERVLNSASAPVAVEIFELATSRGSIRRFLVEETTRGSSGRPQRRLYP